MVDSRKSIQQRDFFYIQDSELLELPENVRVLKVDASGTTPDDWDLCCIGGKLIFFNAVSSIIFW
jgi:hypothetical protein